MTFIGSEVKNKSYTLLTLYASMACTGTTSPFYLYITATYLGATVIDTGNLPEAKFKSSENFVLVKQIYKRILVVFFYPYQLV
jgi:hypothetical protein